MKRFLLILALLFVCSQARAVTYYIRLDGGTNVQCDGKTNHALAGASGTNCAFNHPYQMLTYVGAWANLVANDTIQFADSPSNTTPYYMGEQNAGVGFAWGGAGGSGPLGGICPAPNQPYPAGAACVLPVIPDGVQIIGQNAGSCHTAGHTGLVTPTILSGINGAFSVLNVQGSNNVSLSCIEITQPDNCSTQGGGSGGGCARPRPTTSPFGGIVLVYQLAQGPRNMTMTDVAVDGTGGSWDSRYAHQRTMSGDVMTVSDLYLIGNGGVGWNADGGGCNGAHSNDCESVGTL